MSKFFRSSQKSGSVPNTPKSSQKDIESFVRYPEDDNLSFGSMGSHLSSSSHLSAFSTLDITDKEESTLQASDVTVAVVEEFVDEQEVAIEHVSAVEESSIDAVKEVFIGSMYEQSLVFYTTRLVSSKFLLTGQPSSLISDLNVRVSIKNLALLVVANCVRLSPDVLFYTIACNSLEPPSFFDITDFGVGVDSDESGDEADDHSEDTTTADNEVPASYADDVQLNIIDDHFGTSSGSYVEFLAPLSKSVETVLTSKATSISKVELRKKTDANKHLSDTLSKSEIIESRNVVESRSSAVSVFAGCGANQDGQLMQDVLLYYDNADPILRGDVQMIVGYFISAVLRNYSEFDDFFRQNSTEADTFLTKQKLMMVLIKVSTYLYNLIFLLLNLQCIRKGSWFWSLSY